MNTSERHDGDIVLSAFWTNQWTDLFHQRLDENPGFEAANLIKAELTLPEHKYGNDESVLAFVDGF